MDTEDLLDTGPQRPAAVTAASVLLFLCALVILFINPIVAIVFGALSVLLFRGINLARITTWLFIAIGVLCLGGGQATRVASGMVEGPRSESAVPPWKWDLATVLDIATLIALIVVAILLALPSSGAFFRRPEEAWTPSTPSSTS